MVAGALASGVLLGLCGWLVSRWWGWVTGFALTALIWWVGVIGLVTLVPLGAIDLAIPAEAAQQSCSLDYGGPAPDGFWIFSGGQRLLNTVLFVPAGALLVLAVARWRAGLVLAPVGLVLLAFYSVGIEFAQLELSRIGRACDVTDIVDNTLGALIGFVIGLVLLPLLRPWRTSRRSPGRN